MNLLGSNDYKSVYFPALTVWQALCAAVSFLDLRGTAWHPGGILIDKVRRQNLEKLLQSECSVDGKPDSKHTDQLLCVEPEGCIAAARPASRSVQYSSALLVRWSRDCAVYIHVALHWEKPDLHWRTGLERDMIVANWTQIWKTRCGSVRALWLVRMWE